MMNEQKILTPELETRVHQAVDNFMQGYGCCQSVVAAFADLYGLDDEMAKRIGAGFGGGVGRMRMMCGAVSDSIPLFRFLPQTMVDRKQIADIHLFPILHKG
jgi:hypothetical protein